MSKPTEQPNEEKKSCRGCAFFGEDMGLAVLGPSWDMSLRGVGKTIGEPTVISTGYSCLQSHPSFNDKNLDNNSCEKFMRKKKGMTLEQQLEEQKQEEIKKQQLAEQARLKKEHDRLRNRLKRNWKAIVGIIGAVASVATIIELYLLLIRW